MTREEHDHQLIREELARVLSSSAFTRNERLSRFLRFLVERHLEGRDEEIKESLIGVEVFGRRPDYDPKLDSIVRTEAGRLRARLIEYYAREGAQHPAVIEVPKGGYRPVFRYAHAIRSYHPRWLAPALVALIAMAAGISWWNVRAKLGPVRIAVLPLQNLSSNPDNDYFADGLTEELITNLSILDGLEVRSRTSSFAFRATQRNLHDVAKQLDVDYVLEGSIARVSNRVRIDARLVRVHDDTPIWSGKFDRALTDILAIEDEISRGIVNNLRLQLGRGRRRYETSMEAYDLYLHGRALSQHERPGASQSMDYYEKAIAKDASLAPAYAALASGYAVRSIQFLFDHPADELSKMRDAADHAIQLDPLLAEAHDALGMIYAREGQWQQAEKSFRHAIELEPNRSTTHIDFGTWFLWVLGRNDEAVKELRLAANADPLSPSVHLFLGLMLISVERYEEAETICSQVRGGTDLELCLARAKFGKGEINEAIRLLASSPDTLTNPEARGFLGFFYAKAGRRLEAANMAAASRYPNEQALIFAGLGEKDRTFEALERMRILGTQRVGIHLNYPEVVSSLRGDRRLQAFRGEVGLPRRDN